MKINIDVELTPQEARELMGWPDMNSLHQTTIDMINEQIKSGNKDVMESMLKPYLDSSQQAFGFYQKMMQAMADSGTKKA